MNEAGREITIGGTTYNMVLNVNAYNEIIQKYGGIRQLADALDDSEQRLTAYPWIVALLVNQGILLSNEENGRKDPLLSPDRITLRMRPYELIRSREAVFGAIVDGMKGEHREDGGSVDEVMEEINAEKNGDSAAG